MVSACRNLQDPNAPVSTQGTSIKLLHSVVEVMFARHGDRATADSYRLQLGRILDVFVSKLSFMKSQIPKLLAAGESFSYGSPILVCQIIVGAARLWHHVSSLSPSAHTHRRMACASA